MGTRPVRKVAIVGNRSFPLTPAIGAQIVDIIREMGDVTILTRGSEGLDDFISRACGVLDIACVLYRLQGKNWDRDVALVRDADEVVVFLDPSSLTDENTGTSHVLAKALDQRKRTQAYSAHGDALVYVGSSGE